MMKYEISDYVAEEMMIYCNAKRNFAEMFFNDNRMMIIATHIDIDDEQFCLVNVFHIKDESIVKASQIDSSALFNDSTNINNACLASYRVNDAIEYRELISDILETATLNVDFAL